jgi:hypothetical protein
MLNFNKSYITFKLGILIRRIQVQLISKLSSTPKKSRSRFITVFSTCKDAFLKFERHRLGKFDNIKCRRYFRTP